ncbi:hypothetical protein CEXT_99901 [Caerostris extrusa]|uniref:RRM domain-containing protein n=1 Tax=Caerostris extrusa TaxID=172846 RepID=A0AAV4XU45_CAEEX|nr:hypothetical protein CEXT_99901 [Caerostris extrusa]
MFANELFGYCKAIGCICHFRFLKDAMGISKGSAYVTYANKGMAENAVASMNNLKVRAFDKITAMKVVDFPK